MITYIVYRLLYEAFPTFVGSSSCFRLDYTYYANATEINLNEISNYSDVESIESIELVNSFDSDQSNKNLLLAGEGLAESYDGGFSETTTASFSVDFAVGAVDGKGVTTAITDGDEAQATYGFQIDLNTSLLRRFT